ncbi:hypothetical protein LTS12_028740, partial [Elasticomyces elasticus]
MIGTIVVEWLTSVVVSQEFAVRETSVRGWIERPGGTVIIVEVTGPYEESVTEFGAGPVVSFKPSFIGLSIPATEVLDGRSDVSIYPRGLVSVFTSKPEVEFKDVVKGSTISVEPAVGGVCESAPVVLRGKFRATVEPSSSVSVRICDARLIDVDTGPRMSFELPFVRVRSSVVDKPRDKMRVIEGEVTVREAAEVAKTGKAVNVGFVALPLALVILTTDADKGLTVRDTLDDEDMVPYTDV